MDVFVVERVWITIHPSNRKFVCVFYFADVAKGFIKKKNAAKHRYYNYSYRKVKVK